MTTGLPIEAPPELTVRPCDGYILATLAGTLSIARLKEVLSEIKTRSAERGSTRVLVDARKKAPLTDIHQRFEVAHWLSHHWSQDLKLAIISSIPLEKRDYLVEGVMGVRHHVVNTFNTEAQALRWLMDDTVQR